MNVESEPTVRISKKAWVISCDFQANGTVVVDFSSEVKRIQEEAEQPTETQKKELNQDLLKELESGVALDGLMSNLGFGKGETKGHQKGNRMTEVIKNIEAMHNFQTEYLNGYDMDDDFIDEDDDVCALKCLTDC